MVHLQHILQLAINFLILNHFGPANSADASTSAAPKPSTAAGAKTKGVTDGAPSGESAVKAGESEPAMSKEDKAAAARERFLARKRKAPA